MATSSTFPHVGQKCIEKEKEREREEKERGRERESYSKQDGEGRERDDLTPKTLRKEIEKKRKTAQRISIYSQHEKGQKDSGRYISRSLMR